MWDKLAVEKQLLFKKIAENNFGELEEIFWIQKLPHSMEIEKSIPTYFGNNVKFMYPQTVDNFDMELTFFQRKRQLDDSIDIIMSENNIFNKLIFMDDVSGLAGKSNNFANFLMFHENLTLLVFTFFIQCTLPNLTGK